jgi:hypothetical protein
LRLLVNPLHSSNSLPFNFQQIITSFLVESFILDDDVFSHHQSDSTPVHLAWLSLMSLYSPFDIIEFPGAVEAALADSPNQTSFLPVFYLVRIRRIKQLLAQFELLQPASAEQDAATGLDARPPPSPGQYVDSLASKLGEHSLPFESMTDDFKLPFSHSEYSGQIRRVCQVDVDAIGVCLHLDSLGDGSDSDQPNFVAENSAAFFGSSVAKFTHINISIHRASKVPTCLDSMLSRDQRPAIKSLFHIGSVHTPVASGGTPAEVLLWIQNMDDSMDSAPAISKDNAMNIVKQAVDEACFQAQRFSSGPDVAINIPFGYTSDALAGVEPASSDSAFHWDNIDNPPQTVFASPFSTMISTYALPVASLQEQLHGAHNRTRNRPLFLLFCHFLSIALRNNADRRRLRFSLIINMYGNKSHPTPYLFPGHITTTIAPESGVGIPDELWQAPVEAWAKSMTGADTLFALLPHLSHVMQHTNLHVTVNPGVTSVAYDDQNKLLLESFSLPGDIGGRRTFAGHAFGVMPQFNSQTILDPDIALFGDELMPGIQPKRVQGYRPLRVATGLVKVL